MHGRRLEVFRLAVDSVHNGRCCRRRCSCDVVLAGCGGQVVALGTVTVRVLLLLLFELLVQTAHVHAVYGYGMSFESVVLWRAHGTWRGQVSVGGRCWQASGGSW